MIDTEIGSKSPNLINEYIGVRESRKTALVFSIVKTNEFKGGFGTSKGEISTKEMLKNMGYNYIRFFSITRGGIYFKFLERTLNDMLEFAENQKLKRPLLVVDDIQEFRDLMYAYQFKIFERKFNLKDSVEIFCEGSREIPEN